MSPGLESRELFRVGILVVSEADLSHRLASHYQGRTDKEARSQALQDLVRRARLVQAAIGAGLPREPNVRDELGRLLAARYREQEIASHAGAQGKIPESRLRQLYEADRDRFQSAEKRQVAEKLEEAERRRLQAETEAAFEEAIAEKYPVKRGTD